MVNDKVEKATRYLYVFLDEGGDLKFADQGSRFFTMSAVSKERPFTIEPTLLDLKYDLIEFGMNIEYFHASEDRQPVGDRVFDRIMRTPDQLRVDTIVAENSEFEVFKRGERYYY